LIIHFVGHSGSGKSSLMRALIKVANFQKPVWYTTRAPRGDSDDEYLFGSVEWFIEQSKQINLEEVGLVYGNLYATHYPDTDSINYVNVANVDGVSQAKGKYLDDSISIFVECPEEERLRRMLARGDSKEKSQERIEKDRELFKNAFHVSDYKITSSSPEDDVKELLDILKDIELSKGADILVRK